MSAAARPPPKPCEGALQPSQCPEECPNPTRCCSQQQLRPRVPRNRPEVRQPVDVAENMRRYGRPEATRSKQQGSSDGAEDERVRCCDGSRGHRAIDWVPLVLHEVERDVQMRRACG